MPSLSDSPPPPPPSSAPLTAGRRGSTPTAVGISKVPDPAFTRPPLHRSFSALLSTEDLHRTNIETGFSGSYASIREGLDYDYHANYQLERQELQDTVIDTLISSSHIVDINGFHCTTPTQPWLVFTAGPMGAGKSWVIRRLMERGVFPLMAFVGVDPDVIRRYLPEWDEYVKEDPSVAGEMTRKESGYIVEILTEAALRSGKNVLVDGSLRDVEWYSGYFERLRLDYPNLRIAILSVEAGEKVVLERARKRGVETKRVVPEELLMEAIKQVPESVRVLKEKVDYCAIMGNEGDNDVALREIFKDGVKEEYGVEGKGLEKEGEGREWQAFKDNWMQTCKWIRKSEKEKEASNNNGGAAKAAGEKRDLEDTLDKGI